MKLSFNLPEKFFNIYDYETLAQKLRRVLNKKRLPPKYSAFLKTSIEKHNIRQKNKYNDSFGMDALLKKYCLKSEPIIEEIFKKLYKVSTSSWAGGINEFDIDYSENHPTHGISEIAWSKNRKWRGTNGKFSIRISKTWLTSVYFKGIHHLGGMLTLEAKEIPGADGIRLFKAAWIEQGKGFNIHRQNGYIAEQEGESYHASSAKSALIGLKRKLGYPNKKLNYSLNNAIKKYGNTLVLAKDSYAIGNCESGTRSWCEAVGLDFSKGSATLQEVINGYSIRPLKEALNVINFVIKREKEKS